MQWRDVVQFKKLISSEIANYLEDIAKLRIQVFRDYPYLYDGDINYESRYLQTYIESQSSMIVIAMDEKKVVGASSCLSMVDEWDDFKSTFIQNKIDPKDVFYFGESVLLPNYRGKGIGKNFFKIREQHARDINQALKYTAFCAVDRGGDHPLKPENYIPLDGFWKSMGYKKQNHLIAKTSWKDVDKSEEDLKSLVFWLKAWNL